MDKYKLVNLNIMKLEETKTTQEQRANDWEQKLENIQQKAKSLGIDYETLLKTQPKSLLELGSPQITGEDKTGGNIDRLNQLKRQKKILEQA